MPVSLDVSPDGPGARRTAADGSSTPLIALVGNPNCGKSTLYNALTGGNRAVGNWAGVTVDHAVGYYDHHGRQVALVDLPGVYSLSAATVDERVTCTFVSRREADVIVNVLDASNLERNLYLTMQLAELGVPMVFAVNMLDMADQQGVDIDVAALADQLGCPVVAISASRRNGLDALRTAIDAALEHRTVPTQQTAHAPLVDEALDALAAELASSGAGPDAARWSATRLLEYHVDAEQDASPTLLALRDGWARRIEDELDEEPDILVADARYGRIAGIVDAATTHRGRIGSDLTERLDRIALHPRLGVPVFLGVMYVMFMLTINVGSAFIDLFDQLGGLFFVEIPGAILSAVGMPDAIVVLVAGGIGGGLQSVATFFPPVGVMFICLRFLEESGYMARAAFVMDRFMRALGLPGKAFVPMIVGFGCNVPAIMGARTLERERDRKLAVSINPFMSCGARLPVYALFAAAFFPSSGQMVVFALYLLGIGFAILTGLILKGTLLTGELTPFVMELPPYHRPALGSVLRGAWTRLRSFLVGAGKIIVPVVAALTLLGSMGTDGSFHHENSEQSVLSAIGKTITPAFAPMGIEEDNWPATVGIFTGIFAKEAVVGTLDALYSRIDGTTDAAAGAGGDGGLDVGASLAAAFATVPPNLADAVRSMVDPLGLSVGPISTEQAAAAAQGVSTSTYTAMVPRFDGQVGAFAYLVFILLYLPCVAATAAIARETSNRWALFVGAWTTGLAFAAATVTYQLGTFSEHPGSSAMWVGLMVGAFLGVVTWMRTMGAGDDDLPARSASTVAPVSMPPARPVAIAAPPTPHGSAPTPSPDHARFSHLARPFRFEPASTRPAATTPEPAVATPTHAMPAPARGTAPVTPRPAFARPSTIRRDAPAVRPAHAPRRPAASAPPASTTSPTRLDARTAPLPPRTTFRKLDA